MLLAYRNFHPKTPFFGINDKTIQSQHVESSLLPMDSDITLYKSGPSKSRIADKIKPVIHQFQGNGL